MNDAMNSSADSSTDHDSPMSEALSPPPQSSSETLDVGALQTSPLTVRLIVGEGSRAGAVAEIRLGVYMIGRHRECQIRPKSPSVSRRHCLVHHRADSVRVLDLESKRGTFVNEVRLVPKTWHKLAHGDRLRCGRYWFEVAIYRREVDIELDHLHQGSDDDLSPSDSDIGVIGDDELFDDTAFTVDVNAVIEGVAIDDATFDDVKIDDVASEEPDAEVAVEAVITNEEARPPAPAKKVSKPPIRLPKPKISRRSSGPSRLSIDFGGTDSWKIWLAALTMVSVLGYVGWSIYKFQRGPEVKIIRGID